VDLATLQNFDRIKDAVAAVPGKLAKQGALAEYLRGLAVEDLRLAVRFAAGRAFAASDQRVLAVGGALVWDVLLRILPVDSAELRRLAIESGEIGEAISKVWVEKEVERRLTLGELGEAFSELAITGAQESKREILFNLFGRCATGREASYLTKIIFGDMRSGAAEGVLQAAVALAFEKKLPQIQRCQMLVGDLEEVAVLAKEDRLCDASLRLFHAVQFMLATPQETAEDAAKTLAGRAFFVEDKLDGIRAQVHKRGDEVAIFTRTMDRADESFPELVAAMKKIAGDFLIDGEIVPFAGEAVSPFGHLQRRLGRKRPSAGVLKKYPVKLVAFDLLFLDGETYLERALHERRAALENLAGRSAGAGGRLEITRVSRAASAEEIAAAFELAKARRNEGLILKDPESIYSPGRRGKFWLKLKSHLPTLDCVVTAAEYGHGKRRGVLSDYTFAVWRGEPGDAAGELVNIGKAFSGVTDAEIAQLTELFKSISIANDGHTFFVPPRVVMEIAFDQIQRSGRHAGGFALRFPRIKTVRWDKRPADADRIERVEEIYQSLGNTARGGEEVEEREATLFDHLDRG
jgi:DNA ligase-1